MLFYITITIINLLIVYMMFFSHIFTPSNSDNPVWVPVCSGTHAKFRDSKDPSLFWQFLVYFPEPFWSSKNIYPFLWFQLTILIKEDHLHWILHFFCYNLYVFFASPLKILWVWGGGGLSFFLTQNIILV